MRKKIFILCFLLFVVASFLFYIIKDNNTKDSFYSNSCGYDCKKIPLIKPYYLCGLTGIEGIWYLTDADKNGLAISYINILDSVIISYYFDKYIIEPKNRDTTWYIHIPAQKKEYKFSSEEKFYEHVSKLSNKQVQFIEVHVLYKELVENGYLDWFPEEY